MHVHICVDAQTGMVRMPPRPYSANIGSTAATVSHRVEKQRMFKNYIMENLLTATNTFHFEDDGAIDLYTCNYNRKHEPQQIDHMLSSDNSVRSRTFDASATKSDHWGLIAAIKSKHVKTPRKKKKRTENRLAGNVGIASATTVKCVLFFDCG